MIIDKGFYINETLKLLAIFPHPDDETLGVGSTLARYSAEGVETQRLDNNKYMDRVRNAIRCHKSQLPGFGPIAQWPVDELAKIFGMGCFYRTFSLVNGGRRVETDLFEGLR